MQYSQCLRGMLIGILFLDEAPDAAMAIGIAIIISAGLMILTHRPRAENRA